MEKLIKLIIKLTATGESRLKLKEKKVITMKLSELVLITILFGCATSKHVYLQYSSVDSDSEGGVSSDSSSSSFEVNEDEFSSKDIHEIRKRETLPLEKSDMNETDTDDNTSTRKENATFNLMDVLTRIEEGFVKSASRIVEVFRNSNANDTILDDEMKMNESLHSVQKRNILNSTATEEPVSEISKTEVKKVPPLGNTSAHVSIDRVAIYPSSGYFPVVPSFDYHIIPMNLKNETEEEGELKNSSEETTTTLETDRKEDNNGKEIVSKENTSTSNSDITKQIVSERLASNQSDPIVTTSPGRTSATSTTKDSIKELKEKEEEIKEKIAEIEAEPIILSSRV